MKALTIKQPWASLIVEGIKDIENRTWKTNYRGRIYVHSSAQNFKSLVSSCLNYEQSQIYGSKFPKSGSKPTNDVSSFPHSAIIGEVDIIDCVQNHPSVWAEQMDYYVCPENGLHILKRGQPYVWNWVLANPVKYDQPILNVKGALSFWEFKEEAGL